MNAQALRFLSLLGDSTIHVRVYGHQIKLPHPAYFALQKVIISQRRSKEDKAVKDMEAGIRVLNALIQKGELFIIKEALNSLPFKWRNKVRNGLQKQKETRLLEQLNI